MIIEVSITGDKRVLAMLERTRAGIVNLQVPLTEAAKYLVDYFSGVAFVSRGSVYGEEWAPLSPAYERWKLKHYGSRPLLIRTGEMQRSFKYQAGTTDARIYNTSPHFAVHQTGGVHMPRRAMMGVNDTNRRQVNQIVNDYITKQLVASVAG